MKLQRSITVTPSYKKADGLIYQSTPIILNELNFLLIDNANAKKVIVMISYIPLPLVLWEGVAYDEVGDYTQVQVENRIIELLGDDPSLVLNSLFITSSN